MDDTEKAEVLGDLISCFDVGFQGSPLEEDKGAIIESDEGHQRIVEVLGSRFRVTVEEIG